MKLNCNACINGKHEDCIDENCLCREGHDKQELKNIFTAKTKEVLPSHAELKQRIREHPENYQFTTEKKLLDFAKSIMELYPFKTLMDTKEILYYEDGVYKIRGDVIIKQECERIIPDCSKYKVSEVMGVIERNTYESRENFNNDLSKLVLVNGMLDLVTFELSPFDPKFLTTIKIPVMYDVNARCPKFIQFLKEILPKKKDIITVIEESSNILTTNQKNFEVSAIWIGVGANGKSTLLKIIRGVYGRDNCSSVSIHDIEEQRFAVAQLYSKLANISADISNDGLEGLSRFKQLVSGDPIQVENKGTKPFDLYNMSKLFFSANDMPNIKDNSDGAFRRILVTKFENTFLRGANCIQDLDKIILESEQSGIFNLFLENYKTLLRNNCFRYEQPIGEVREIIKKESDKLLEFIRGQTSHTMNSNITKAQFYEVLVKYMNDKNYEVFSKQKVGATLPTYGIIGGQKNINGHNDKYWFNISWNKESHFIKNTVKGLDSYA